MKVASGQSGMKGPVAVIVAGSLTRWSGARCLKHRRTGGIAFSFTGGRGEKE